MTTTTYTTTNYVEPARTLPLGVAILAVLIGIVGALFLIASILLLLFSGVVYFHAAALFGYSLLGAILLLIVGIILLVVASGLWHLELWALVLSIIVLLVLLANNVVQGAIISLSTLVLALLLVYLVAVHRHFT
jgi:hypothetical protein